MVVVINDVLLEAARSRPGVIVPEWGTRLRARPDWVGPDGLHLSPVGEAELHMLLIGELHACLDPPHLSPTPTVAPALPA
jgi:hypothetical protein